MNHPIINNKKELFEHFQINIFNAYNQLLENKKFDHDNSLLKTYLLEHDIPKGEDPIFYIKNNFLLKVGPKKIIKPIIRQTKDSELLNLRYKDNLDVYIDLSHDRIWNMYSLGASDKFEKLIQNVSYSTFFDNIWLNHDFLKEFQNNNGISRGFGLDFDYKKFENEEDSSPTLKMQLSGMSLSDKVLDALHLIPELKNHITLSKVKMKKFDKDDNSMFILEDIKYNGKISVRGSDINQHLSTIFELKKDYMGLLTNIENNYRIGWKRIKGNIYVEGYPLYFLKNDEKINVDLVCEKMFDGSRPFKLLGIPKDIKGGKVVEVFDMHIGGVFTIQIFPDMFVIYLNEEICGNTILRFYTNLQHSFSNSFIILNDNEDRIL